MSESVQTEAGVLSRLLPYWKYDQHYLFHDDGKVTAGFELRGVSLEAYSEEQCLQFQEEVLSFLHVIPQKVSLQFVFQIRPSSPLLEMFSTYTSPEPFLDKVWKQTVQHYKTHSNIWHSRVFLFVTLVPETRKEEKTTWTKIKDILGGSSSTYVLRKTNMWRRSQTQRIYHVADQIKSALSQMQVNARELTQIDFDRYLYQQLNPRRAENIPYDIQFRDDNDNESYVREKITFSSLQRFPREFILDDYIHRVMSLKDIPQRQSLVSMSPLLQQREFPLDICVGVEACSPENILKELRRARNVQANLTTSGKKDEHAEHEHRILQETIHGLVEGEHKAFRTSYQIHFWGRNDLEIEEIETNLRSLVHQCSEAKELREEFSYPASFFGMLPGGFEKVRTKRALPMISSQTVSLLPLYQHPRGAAHPVVLFKSRCDELTGFDPFDPRLAASNAIIFGPTGRGKSFLAQYLLLHYTRIHAKMIIVDIGGSYRRLTELLGGVYIDLQADGDCSLNPFLSLRGELEPGYLGELAGVVERMVKDEGEQHLNRVQQHYIRKAIKLLYQENQDQLHFRGLYSCFEKLAQQSDDKDDRALCLNLAKRLSLWIEGEGGKLLCGSHHINFNAPLVTVDLAGIPPVGDLQAIVMQILATLIRFHVSHVDGPKIILFDEVWKHLGDPAAATVLDELYRTARKRYSSVISISQKLDDFLNPTIQTSIIQNSDIRFVLKTIEELPLLQKVFKLNVQELELIKGLRMRRGVFSEIFGMVGEEHSVLQVEVTPWIYWMCTTHPPELQLEKFYQFLFSEADLNQRISWLSAHFPHGITSDELESAKAVVKRERG